MVNAPDCDSGIHRFKPDMPPHLVSKTPKQTLTPQVLETYIVSTSLSGIGWRHASRALKSVNEDLNELSKNILNFLI